MTVIAFSTTSSAGLESAEITYNELVRQGALVVVVVREAKMHLDDASRPDLIYLYRTGRYGLSAARNEGLRYAWQRQMIDNFDVVFFPDDDNRPSPDLVEQVEAAFEKHGTGTPGIVGRYGPSLAEVDRQRYPDTPMPVDRRSAESLVSSNTLYLRGWVITPLAEFDTRFGLGARFESAEDMDYALRAMKFGPLQYEPAVYVNHPYKQGLFARNYPGNVAVKVKNGDRIGALRLLAYGLKRVRAGELPVATWRRAAKNAAAVARNPRTPGRLT